MNLGNINILVHILYEKSLCWFNFLTGGSSMLYIKIIFISRKFLMHLHSKNLSNIFFSWKYLLDSWADSIQSFIKKKNDIFGWHFYHSFLILKIFWPSSLSLSDDVDDVDDVLSTVLALGIQIWNCQSIYKMHGKARKCFYNVLSVFKLNDLFSLISSSPIPITYGMNVKPLLIFF